MICPWYFHWDLADFHHPVMLDDTRARSPARSGAAPKGTRGPPAAFGWTAATVGLETFSLALVLSSHELFFPSFMIPSKNPMKFIPIVQICSNIKKKNVYFFAFSFVGWPVDPRASGDDSRHLWHPLAAAHSAARWRPARPPPAVPRYLGEGPKGEGRREDFAENLALYGKLWE